MSILSGPQVMIARTSGGWMAHQPSAGGDHFVMAEDGNGTSAESLLRLLAEIWPEHVSAEDTESQVARQPTLTP